VPLGGAIVDEPIANLRVVLFLERGHHQRQDPRLVVEKKNLSVDFRPVGMRAADGAQSALAQGFVRDGGHGARRQRTAARHSSSHRYGLYRLFYIVAVGHCRVVTLLALARPW